MFRRKMLLPSSAFIDWYSKRGKKAEAVSTIQLSMLEQVNETDQWSLWRLQSQSLRIPYRSMFRNVFRLYRSKRCYSREHRSFPCHLREKLKFNNTNGRDATFLRNAMCFIPNKRLCEDWQGTQQNALDLRVSPLHAKYQASLSVAIKLIDRTPCWEVRESLEL
jgi:hypothetical protein